MNRYCTCTNICNFVGKLPMPIPGQEVLELPETALREAIVNALCHRDYLQEGAQVVVEIFDDYVEIYNQKKITDRACD